MKSYRHLLQFSPLMYEILLGLLPKCLASVSVEIFAIECDIDNGPCHSHHHFAVFASKYEVPSYLLATIVVPFSIEAHVCVIEFCFHGPVVDQGVRRFDQKC